MPIPGKIAGSLLGPDIGLLGVVNSGLLSYAMASLNTGWCVRFTAETTDDITAFRQRWASVSVPGTIRYRLETIDATTGKPSGTLYDANATIDITPAAGVQLYTFATPPTTGLVVGDEYALLGLTTGAGTTQTLTSGVNGSGLNCKYPSIVLTAADGTTRSNFAEVSSSLPAICLVDETGFERYSNQFMPYYQANTNAVFGASTWAASRIVIDFPVKVAGVRWIHSRNGTPAGDLRLRVFTDEGVLVAGTTITIDKDSLTSSNNRPSARTFVSVVTLSPGTYRVVFDSAASANSSNCWQPASCSFLDGDDISSNYRLSTSTDGGATWTNSITEQAAVWFMLDNLDSIKRARFIHQ